jgi:hypothetical protein
LGAAHVQRHRSQSRSASFSCATALSFIYITSQRKLVRSPPPLIRSAR